MAAAAADTDTPTATAHDSAAKSHTAKCTHV